MRARTAALALLLCTCASSGAPPGYLRNAEQLQTATLGAWITISVRPGFEPALGEGRLAGELIAVAPDGLFVLLYEPKRDGSREIDPARPRRLVHVPRAAFGEARLAWLDTREAGLAAWTGVGVLATLSNGFFAIITAPLWILTGTGAAAVESRAGLLDYPAVSFVTLEKYARFPQGLPQGVDEAVLTRRRPWQPPAPDAGASPDSATGLDGGVSRDGAWPQGGGPRDGGADPAG